MNYKKESDWIIKEYPAEKADEISRALSLSPLAARILVSRGVDTPGKAVAFLKKSLGTLHNPFLLDDMDKACDIIASAVGSGKKLLVYGDYDVDGVTSTVIVYSYLRSLGADISTYIPERETDGYGLSPDLMRRFVKEGYGVVITVDSGITAYEEALIAKEAGIKLVITDHHLCREDLPLADAIVNPRRISSRYPFCELAGVGVAFKLLCALDSVMFDTDVRDSSKKILALFSDLVSIGTIADVMPLTDENRVIVSYGLEHMEDTDNLGLAALFSEVGLETKKFPPKMPYQKKKITSSQIGFVIAPRINACGRISSAMRAVELFTTENRTTAKLIASELCAVNKQRQTIENGILEDTLKYVEESVDLEKDLFIVAESETWHHGVIGIVASRICEKYHLPCILVSFAGEQKGDDPGDDVGKGSGRSIAGYNLVEALSSVSDLLEKYGGHSMAAGLSVKRRDLPELRRRLCEHARKNMKPGDLTEKITVDAVLEKEDITLKSASDIQKLEPFGLGNPVPVFASYGMRIAEIIPISEGKHIKLTLEKDALSVTGIFFGAEFASFPFFAGDRVDVLYNLDVNTFRDTKTLQLVLRDVRRSKLMTEAAVKKSEQYAALKEGVKIPDGADLIPDRDDFRAAYVYLKKKHSDRSFYTTELSGQAPREGFFRTDVLCMSRYLSTVKRFPIGIVKLLIILDVFDETGIISREKTDDPLIQKIRLADISNQNKINLERSELLRRLKGLYR